MADSAPVSQDVDDEELIAAAEEIEEARELAASALGRLFDPRTQASGFVDTAYSRLTLADTSINHALKIRGIDRKEQTERMVEHRKPK